MKVFILMLLSLLPLPGRSTIYRLTAPGLPESGSLLDSKDYFIGINGCLEFNIKKRSFRSWVYDPETCQEKRPEYLVRHEVCGSFSLTEVVTAEAEEEAGVPTNPPQDVPEATPADEDGYYLGNPPSEK